MRPVSPLHPWYPDVRAVRIALASVAVAGLVVIAACTDAGDKAITAPQAPRMDNIPSGGFGNAKTVQVCVTGPAGNYSFVNSHMNDASGGLPGNAFFDVGTQKWWDIGDGGDGDSHVVGPDTYPTTVFTPANSNAYVIAAGACQTVLERTLGDFHFMSVPANDPQHQENDSWASVNVLNTVRPAAVNYDHTNCTIDNGAPVPQQSNPPNTFTTWGNNGLFYSQGSPPNYLCDTHNNPTRAFANFEHGVILTFVFVSAPILEDCFLGYPYTSANSRTSVDFNESEVLTGFQLIGASLHGWYTDEHAMTLGVDSIFIDNKAPKPDSAFGINTLPAIPDGNSYQIEKMSNNPTSSTTASATGSPLLKIGRVGTTTKPVGQGNAIDPAGRPLFPALYITDITGLADNLAHTDPAIRAGDWQYSTGIGIPNIPSAVYGTWKAAVLKIDNTKTPSVTTLVNRADPAKNHKVVGAGGVNPPAGAIDNGYSSDVVWDLANLHDNNNLALVAGNRYRAQFIVHDGDQNKTGGDVGQACVNLTR